MENKSFDNVSWLLDAVVSNFCMSIVDDSVKANADFQYSAGMSPKIVRTTDGKCCEWCSRIAGAYDYEKVKNTGNDVFRRHRNCTCVVEYLPGDGRRQNVHTKQWVTEPKGLLKDTIVKRYRKAKLDEAIGRKYAKQSVESSAKLSNIKGSGASDINCQRCVQAYELNRRGYKVCAKPYMANGKITWGDEIYVDKDGKPVHFKYYQDDTDIFDIIDNSPEGARYSVYFQWQDESAHVFVVERENGELHFIDPQDGDLNCGQYLAMGKPGSFGILRTDDKYITSDTSILQEVVEKL